MLILKGPKVEEILHKRKTSFEMNFEIKESDDDRLLTTTAIPWQLHEAELMLFSSLSPS